MNDKQIIDNLHFQVGARDRRIAELERTNKQLSANLRYRKQEVETLEEKTAEQEEEINQLNEKVRELEIKLRPYLYREMMKAQGRW